MSAALRSALWLSTLGELRLLAQGAQSLTRVETTRVRSRVECLDCEGPCDCVRSDPAAERDWSAR